MRIESFSTRKESPHVSDWSNWRESGVFNNNYRFILASYPTSSKVQSHHPEDMVVACGHMAVFGGVMLLLQPVSRSQTVHQSCVSDGEFCNMGKRNPLWFVCISLNRSQLSWAALSLGCSACEKASEGNLFCWIICTWGAWSVKCLKGHKNAAKNSKDICWLERLHELDLR